MLVSDKYGFIIATPVKTGTTTLLGMAQSWVKQGGSPSVLRALSGDPVTKHRTIPPEGCEGYDRYMTVRDPASRIPSMYEWMRKWEHPAALHNVIVHAEETKGRKYGWREFVRAIAVIRAAEGYGNPGVRRKGTRQPYMWTDNQVEHLNYLQGIEANGLQLMDWYQEEEPGILNTQSLMEDWHALLAEVGVDEDALYELRVPHLNRSKDRLADNPGHYWDLLGPGERSLFRSLSEPDCLAFGWDTLAG